jgi:hypothetical protein
VVDKSEAMTRHLACAVVAFGAAKAPWDWEEEEWRGWEEVEWMDGREEGISRVKTAGLGSAGVIEAGLDSAEVVGVVVVASAAAASAR